MPATGLAVTSITPAGPSLMQITVQGEPGVSYQLQTSELLTVPFFNTGSPVPADALGLAEFTDTTPLPSRRFYKVVKAP